MANGPYRTVPMQIPTLRNTVRPVQLGAGPRPTVGGAMMQQPFPSTSQMIGARNMYAPQSLQAGVMSQAQRPKSQAELLAAYGLGRKPAQTVGGERRGAGAPAARTGMSGMLPAVGTPEMAGLGAAGRTLMQLGGWQDKPMTLGQILGAGAEKGIETMQARRNAMAAAEEKKAAAERQAKLDELSRRNIESQIEARDRPAGAVSAAGKFATDMGFTPGTKEHIAAMQNYIKKETKDKVYGQKTVYDTKNKTAISVAENDPRIQLGGEFLDSDRYRVSNTPQAALDAADIGFSDKVKNDLMNKVITLDMTLDNVSELNRLFKDEYQIIPQKAKYLLTLQAEKWGLTDISPDEERAMSGFVKLRQQANTTLNDYIKAITGAQMSVAEAGRLEKSVPKAGTGLFDGDSPTEFKSKLEQFGRLTKLARARNVYALKNGFQEARTESGQLLGFAKVGARPLTLDRMNQILVKETKDLAKEYQKENDDMSEAESLIQAKSVIESRYGINV